MLFFLKKFKTLLIHIRFLPVFIGMDYGDEKLIMDIARWSQICTISGSYYHKTAVLLNSKKEFRNLFVYRNRSRRLYRLWARVWYHPIDTLFIEAKEIGGGLFIQHGFATMIAAESIGENCWINQQVTIGYKDNAKAPVIGNNVMITCGAKILGNITVGDNAVIGANAVIVKDVEAGAVMGGVPAKRIR